MMQITHCPLCDSPQSNEFACDKRREYLRCCRCALVWVPPEYYLDRAAERSEYDKHNNDVHDPGYRRFLGRVFEPLRAELAAGAHGLDFGCGPGPALAHMLEEAGFTVSLYDPFYFPDPGALELDYDFITATEVVEHLHRPGHELDRLWRLLKPGGVLAVMTKLVIDAQAFARWHYKNDPTHVAFFSRETWRWWAAQHHAELTFHGQDVVLLRKVGKRSSV